MGFHERSDAYVVDEHSGHVGMVEHITNVFISQGVVDGNCSVPKQH